MKIALAQLNPTVGDFEANTRGILDAWRRAADLSADLVVLPELAVCGYPPADLLEKASFLDRARAATETIAAATEKPGSPGILFGTVQPSLVEPGKPARNVAVLCADGAVQFTQCKMLLPFYDVFDEQRYFEPAQSQSLFDFRGTVLAITICEDAWNDKTFWPHRYYAHDPVEQLLAQRLQDGRGADLLLNISASPFWEGKVGVRRQMIAAVARRHGIPAVMVNQVGGNDSLIFDGSSFAVDGAGNTTASVGSFVEDVVVMDTAAGAQAAASTEASDTALAWDALVLGTRDYVRKCGFRSAVVGLSGGVDSALVAAIAVEALGAANVSGIGMPSEYSSQHSVDDARQLAANLGIRFELLPIRPGFEALSETLAPLFQGTPFGLAEENLQSRLRGTLLMALSNKFGSLVLTTGNKSEMSTGYCTLYGDMVGALAVLGDVWKTRVYDLARYANREREVIPQNTLVKPPSAELRPGQMDTDSLPPYEVLDPVLQAYVERYESAETIAQQQGMDVDKVRGILRLVERSEYKRQQAAPVLKITRKSFGSGRRFPIAAHFPA